MKNEFPEIRSRPETWENFQGKCELSKNAVKNSIRAAVGNCDQVQVRQSKRRKLFNDGKKLPCKIEADKGECADSEGQGTTKHQVSIAYSDAIVSDDHGNKHGQSPKKLFQTFSENEIEAKSELPRISMVALEHKQSSLSDRCTGPRDLDKERDVLLRKISELELSMTRISEHSIEKCARLEDEISKLNSENSSLKKTLEMTFNKLRKWRETMLNAGMNSF